MKEKSIIPKSTLLPLAFVILIIAFGVVYILVDKNAEDKDYKIFDVVTPLLALIISVIGSVYVYNAYSAQQEQIKIQKDEIERNRKDVEYNRVLDTVYRQLEFSNNELTEQEKLYYQAYKSHRNLEHIVNYLSQYTWMFKLMETHYKFFDRILDSNNLQDNEKLILIEIIGANYNYKLVFLYMNLSNIISKEGGFPNVKDAYIKLIYNKLLENECKKIGLKSTGNITEIINYVKIKYQQELIEAENIVKDLNNNMLRLQHYIDRYKKD